MPFSHQLKFPSYNGSPVAARLEQWRKKPSDFLERGDVLAEISIDGSAHLLCIDFSCLLSSLIAKTGDLLRTGIISMLVQQRERTFHTIVSPWLSM